MVFTSLLLEYRSKVEPLSTVPVRFMEERLVYVLLWSKIGCGGDMVSIVKRDAINRVPTLDDKSVVSIKTVGLPC